MMAGDGVGHTLEASAVERSGGAVARLSPVERGASVVILLICLATACFMPSHDSIWIDEAMQWRFAEPSLSTWRDRLLGDKNSETQMPLSMLAAWVGGHTLGTSEWSLRAINIPWCMLAIVAMWKIGRRLGIIWLPLLLIVHPFLWYYVNEARPYALQIACGAWLLWGLIEFAESNGQSSRGALALAAAGWALLGASMLGGFTVAGVGAVLMWGWWRKHWGCGRAAGWVLAGSVMLMAPLMFYYARTVLDGAGGSKIWEKVGVGNLVYAIYELAGFGGLGLPRGELRATARGDGAGLVASLKPYLLALAALAAFYMTIIVAAVRNYRRLKGTPAAITSYVPLLVFAALAAAAVKVKFPFWGRHLAPLLAFVVLAMALACRHGFKGTALRWIATGGLMVMLLASAMQLRFSPRHQRDDYRTAATYAREALARGQRVWWAANDEAARYYGLPLDGPWHRENRCIYICGRKSERLESLIDPDIIIFSKPEIYDDERHALANFIDIHRYELIASPTSFRIYRRAI